MRGDRVIARGHEKGQGEARLLAGARLMEEILGLGAITPIDPRPE